MIFNSYDIECPRNNHHKPNRSIAERGYDNDKSTFLNDNWSPSFWYHPLGTNPPWGCLPLHCSCEVYPFPWFSAIALRSYRNWCCRLSHCCTAAAYHPLWPHQWLVDSAVVVECCKDLWICGNYPLWSCQDLTNHHSSAVGSH